jgi:hypothetical protein
MTSLMRRLQRAAASSRRAGFCGSGRRGGVKFPSDKLPNVTDADPDDARRAKAYFDMEPHICDVVYMAKIAVEVLNHPGHNLHQFAVYRLSEMLDGLKARYYAMDFPA